MSINELEIKTTKYYGNYRGLVLDSNDPYKAGRIKIQVYPMFSEILNPDLLPWATPAMPISAGAGFGFGTLNIPMPDSYVWVFFEAGDPYQPVYFAEAQTASMGIPAEGGLNYPFRRVTTYPSGITSIIDDAAASIFLVHPMGTIIEILGDGQINVQGARGIAINVNDDAIINAGMNASISAGINAVVQANANIDINAGYLVKVTALAVEVDADTVIVNAKKDAQVNCMNAEVFATVDAYIEGSAYVIIKGGIVSINPA